MKAIRYTLTGCPVGADMAANIEPLRPKVKCPECKRESARATYPFCSVRCKEVDLNRWLSGEYVIPGPQLSDEDDYENVDYRPDVKD
mgnify:CR=1 FL=1